MQIASFSTLLLAMVLASPALYSGFVTHQLEPRVALIRLLIAVPVAALMLWALRILTSGYGQSERKTDETGPVQAEAVAGEPFVRRTVD